MKRVNSDIPDITVLIVTLNNERTLPTCLERVIRQDYPKDKIEYLAVDGGSTDRTKEIFREYGFKIIQSQFPKNAEAQRGVGIQAAKNNLIISLDSDNYMPNDQWFRQMVKPFVDDPEVVHAHTIHYAYRSDETIFNRYVGLFGMADPVVYYVGRPDRLPYYKNDWKLGTIYKETNDYFLVKFTKDSLPTVGCNGVAYRRDVLLKHAKSSPKEFLHIDVFADLIDAGFCKFAVVKNEVLHSTATSMLYLIKKRILFLDAYYLPMAKQRRYLIYDPTKVTDRVKLILFALYTITFIKPLLDSVVGFISIPDRAWFVHPIVCWIYLVSYGYAAYKSFIKKFV